MATGDAEARDEDRLPWLETAEEEYADGPSLFRIILVVVVALALVAAAIFGYQYYRQHRSVDGNGALIAAPQGDYKVKPDDPGGQQVEGEGDVATATSNGAGIGNAAIDMQAQPETPIEGKKAPPVTVDVGEAQAVTVIPAPRATPAAPVAGALVQLGSYGAESEANAAWARISKAHGYLAPLGKSVQAGQVGGRTVYRLRVDAGSAGQAASLCSKLKAAGQACFVPRG